jgi:hypothetical protein
MTVHPALTWRVKAEPQGEDVGGLLDFEGAGREPTTHGAYHGRRSAGIQQDLDPLPTESLHTNRSTPLWQKEDVASETWEPPLPAGVQGTATLGRTALLSPRGPQG